jgi:hypothetical protein
MAHFKMMIRSSQVTQTLLRSERFQIRLTTGLTTRLRHAKSQLVMIETAAVRNGAILSRVLIHAEI